MSSLEHWIDTSFKSLSKKQKKKIINIVSEYRDTVEYEIAHTYKPNRDEWEEFCESLWFYIPLSYREQIHQIVYKQ